MNFQRVGAPNNAYVGRSFEAKAAAALQGAKVFVSAPLPLAIGVGKIKKVHKFDLGSQEPPIVVECKSHRWTAGKNVPSAKLTVWNEAMYYFSIAPAGFRRIFFVLRDYSTKHNCTLAEYYLRTYPHFIPDGVEVWEFNETNNSVSILQ